MLLKKYIGTTIKGECNGFFGTTDTGEKKIVIISNNFLIAKPLKDITSEEPLVAFFEEFEENDIEDFITAWQKGENYIFEEELPKGFTFKE